MDVMKKYIYGFLLLILVVMPGMCCAYTTPPGIGPIGGGYSAGYYGLAIYADPNNEAYREISKVELLLSTRPEYNIISACGPYMQDTICDWTTEIKQLPDTGLTSIMWTAKDEPLYISSYGCVFVLQVELDPWSIPIGKQVLRIWGANNTLLYDSPFGTEVPEPGSLVALGLGIAPMAGVAFRKRRSKEL